MSISYNLKSSFLQNLITHNRPHLDSFRRWIFDPGMLYASHEKWWGDGGNRPAPHEGLDLCGFEDSSGNIKTLAEYIKIPAAFAGEIIKIENDFLGKSIFIRHEIADNRGRRLYSLYGHTAPKSLLLIGSRVLEGQIIATVSIRNRKLTIPHHLHITFACIPELDALNDLTWNTLTKIPGIELIDPLLIIG